MNPIYIQFFGGVQLEQQNQLIQLGSKQVMLIAYLAVMERPFSRAHLVETCWPDTDPARSRRWLSDSLYRIRQRLGDNFLVIQKEQITINREACLKVDVWTFQQHAQSQHPADWQTAVSLYQGDLLPEFAEDWVLEKRVYLQEIYFATLLRLAKHAESIDDFQTAQHCYQTLKQTDPLQENATRGLMRTFAKQGQFQEALRVYQQLCQRLETLLQVEPTQPTQTLAAQLQKELELQTAVKQRSSQHPLVGRIQERAQLLSQLDQAFRGNGRINTILGAAGIGKTRLLQSLAEAAAWRGWQITWGVGEQFGHPAPYTPFADALVDALPTPRQQQLTQLIQPSALDLIQNTFLSPDPNINEMVSSQNLQQAIYQTLHGLQQITPHLLILDDVQWADNAIWPLLSYLQPLLNEQRLFILLTGRIDTLRQQETAWQSLQTWEQAGETVIHLQGLDKDALQELAAHQNKTISSHDLTELQQASGGNPLLALALISMDTVTYRSKSLSDFTAQQLTAVSEPAQLALQAASVLGFKIDYALWENILTPIDAVDLPQLAGELEQARLIQLTNDVYQFAHDTLRAAVYNSIPPQRRQRLHQNVFTQLRHVPQESALKLTYHAEQAGDNQATAQYALIAGLDALKRFSYETAVSMLSKAIENLDSDDLTNHYNARYGRARANDILAQRQAQQEDLTQLHHIARQLNDPAKIAQAHALNGRYAYTLGHLEEALDHTKQALVLAIANKDLTQQANLYHQLGQIVREQGETRLAHDNTQKANNLYEQIEDRHGQATTIDILGGLAWAQGDYEKAIENHAQAAQLFHNMGNPFNEAMALNNLGSAYWGTGAYQQAEETLQNSLNISRELGHKRGEGDNLDNLGGISWVLADYETAVSYYTQALTIRRQIKDQWGISISLGNLGSAYRLMGKWDEALAHYAEALQVNRTMGRRRGEGYNLHGRGLTYLDMGHYQHAAEDLCTAYQIRVELNEQENQLETLAGLGIVSIAREDFPQAKAYLQEIENRQGDKHRASLRQWTHYAAFVIHDAVGNVEQAIDHLHQAEHAMFQLADSLPAKDRTRYLQNFPLNRQIQTAVSQYTQQVTVQLVQKDVPLGRKLTPNDYVNVCWTIHNLTDQNITETAVRRRAIIQRLIQEAEQQNAAPTDNDLAAALNVSRRTILRDMKVLNDTGVSLPTRKRE